MRDTYLGGESDSSRETMPKRYEDFFNERHMFAVLGLLVLFLVLFKMVIV